LLPPRRRPKPEAESSYSFYSTHFTHFTQQSTRQDNIFQLFQISYLCLEIVYLEVLDFLMGYESIACKAVDIFSFIAPPSRRYFQGHSPQENPTPSFMKLISTSISFCLPFFSFYFNRFLPYFSYTSHSCFLLQFFPLIPPFKHPSRSVATFYFLFIVLARLD
jgi:hypothetical protein